MSAITPIAGKFAEKISKMVCLILGAGSDSEALAAMRGLRRTLRASGNDMHTLTDVIKQDGDGALSEAEMKKLYDAGFTAGHAAASRELVVTRPDRFHEPSEWRTMLEFCQRHARILGSRDRDFLESMADWDDEPSEKQAKWLNDIAARLRRRGAT